jgi:hypothetical protein
VLGFSRGRALGVALASEGQFDDVLLATRKKKDNLKCINESRLREAKHELAAGETEKP